MLLPTHLNPTGSEFWEFYRFGLGPKQQINDRV